MAISISDEIAAGCALAMTSSDFFTAPHASLRVSVHRNDKEHVRNDKGRIFTETATSYSIRCLR